MSSPGPYETRRSPVWLWFAASISLLFVALCIAVSVMAVRFQAWQREQMAETEALRQQLAERRERAAPAEGRAANETALRGGAKGAASGGSDVSEVPVFNRAADAAAKDASGATLPRDRLIADLVGSIVLITALDEGKNALGIGSGFVVNEAGLVATNFHVVKGASAATATFRDKTVCQITGARASAPEADLVLLQLDAPPADLRPLKLADDESPAPGTDVTSIGHPEGFQFSSSGGVVGAVHMTADLPQHYRRQIDAPPDQVWVQTTAVIAGGSSGGPLLNARGEVLGVNTWLAAGERLGFAAHVKHLRALLYNVQSDVVPLAEIAQPDAALNKLVTQYVTERNWFIQGMQTANNDEERLELAKTKDPGPKFASQFVELATRHRKTKVALKSLQYACQLAANDESNAAAQALQGACDRLLEDHSADPALSQLVQLVSGSPHQVARDFLAKTSDLRNNQLAAGLSCYLLATVLTQDPGCSDDDRQRAESLLERVLRDFRDVQVAGSSLGQIADQSLYVLKHLSVGCPAPDIVGKDSQDRDLKLSDFHGKVVLLDFWGSWCPHCVRMFPHERQLVEKYADRPFVLLGVNDDDLQTLREVEGSKQVTWRSWTDGHGGPIATKWRSDGVPQLYLIDHAGTIRRKWSGYQGSEIDESIEDLVQKAAAVQSSAASLPADLATPAVAASLAGPNENAGQPKATTNKEQATQSVPEAPAREGIIGEWINADPGAALRTINKPGLNRLVVAKKDEDWSVEVWESGGAGEIAWGNTDLNPTEQTGLPNQSPRYVASWDHGSAESQLTLWMENDLLFADFRRSTKDGSGRPKLFYTLIEKFKAQPVADADSSTPSPVQPGNNLLMNGSFEDGTRGWSAGSWRENLEAASVQSQEAKDGKKALVVRLTEADDARYVQKVAIKPNTRYSLSGWIKTKDVEIEKGAKHGANLSLEDTLEATEPLVGTRDWTYVTLIFNSGQRSEVVVYARLGFYSSIATGTAWFDDLVLVELGAGGEVK